MAKIIELEQYKKDKIGKRCFKYWNQHLKQSCSFFTQLRDLYDEDLLMLAAPGEESTVMFYMLIQSVHQENNTTLQDQPPTLSEIEKMDLHLYLADKVRLEMMVRLSWLKSYPQQELSVIDLVRQYHLHRLENYNSPPELSSRHPDYHQYQKLINREKELFIRKLFPKALNLFKSKVIP